MVPPEIVDWVEQLHALVDEVAAPVAAAHASRLRCRRGCSGCCTDELTVFPIEAAVIARHHPELLAEGAPAETGCAFLDATGGCRIYAQRPYVCRTQGLPLRWIDEDDEGPFESRDICPENAEGPGLEELEASQCWTIGPFEERLATRQGSLGGGPERIPLRSLFVKGTARTRLPITKE